MALLPDPTIDELVAAITRARIAQREHGTLAKSTLEAYERYLRFGPMTYFPGRAARSVTTRDVSQMQADVAQRRGLSVGNNVAAETRRLFDFANNTGWLADGYNPAARVKPLPTPKPVRRPLSLLDAERLGRLLHQVVYSTAKIQGLNRVPAACLLLIEITGMRSHEGRDAQLNCFDGDAQLLTILDDKNKKSRPSPKQIPLCWQASKLLDDIKSGHIPDFPRHPIWFFAGNARRGNISDLSTARKTAFQLCEIDAKTVTHDLRHTIAEAAYETESLETVAEMLGHLDVRTTKRYVGGPRPEKARKACQRTVDRMLSGGEAASESSLRDALIRKSLLRDVTNDVLAKLDARAAADEVEHDAEPSRSVSHRLEELRKDDATDA